MSDDSRSSDGARGTSSVTLGDVFGGMWNSIAAGGDVVIVVQPLAEKLAPLVEKVGVAALWVAKLWLAAAGP